MSAAVLACTGLACATTEPGRTAPTAAIARAPSAARHEVGLVDVTVALQAPMRARYVPGAASGERPSLGVVVTNRSPQPLDVADLRVHLEAARGAVAFRCAGVVGPPPGAREPSTLAPGASFVFPRALDCALPLVGAYAVKVAVSFGKAGWRTPREVRAFDLTVTALPNVGPREVLGIPGLWAAMGAERMLAGGAGHGRTLVTLVNATSRPIEVPRMQLELRTYRAGNAIPCEDEPIVLMTPAVLGAAEAFSEPIEVSCLGLSVPGTYEIAARLVVPRASEGDQEIALGRLRVVVERSALTEP
jgi:hypothetical protein